VSLEIKGLEVAYGRTQVLFGVDLEVPDGDLVCIMGRNGVGKSTLMNALMGLLPAKRGTVTYAGRDITKDGAWNRASAGIGYVPQGHQVFPNLTVRENLQVVHEANSARRSDKTAIDDALDFFPVLPQFLNKPAALLSGGQAQQLAIARALVTRPRLLVLDEPTEGIQPSIILEIEDTIVKLHRETQMSILLVEQYVEFALRIAQRYAVMDHGTIVESGDVADADPASFADLLGV
jgi:urea transport system ATP-binding protein